jgi:response regulator RpfG family c-di-GMP phosphodiesterase
VNDVVKNVLSLAIAEEKNNPMNTSESSRKRVLAIDDNNQLLQLYEMVLGREFDLITCKTIKEINTLSSAVDVIIMDYHIVGQDFNVILDFVTKRFEGAKKILITGYLDEYVLKNVNSNFDAIMEKPISMSDLETVVRKMALMSE